MKNLLSIFLAIAAISTFNYLWAVSPVQAVTEFGFIDATNDISDLTTYTFADQDLGTADADRCLIVGIIARKAGATTDISSVTIGGVSATIVEQVTNNVTNSNVAGIASAIVPTGTTGDVVVTFGAGMVRSAIQVYRAVGVDSCTTPHDVAESTAGDPTGSLDVPEDGFAIGVALTAAATTVSWTGLTEDWDNTLESFVTLGAASDEFVSEEAALAITADFGSATESAGVFASWAPAEDEGVPGQVTPFAIFEGDVSFTGDVIISR